MTTHDQAWAGNSFAHVPQGTEINSSNVSNITGQLSIALKNRDLTEPERFSLLAAYANVTARGNVEHVLHGEMPRELAEYNFIVSMGSGGGGSGGGAGLSIRPKMPSYVPVRTNSTKIPFDWRASGDGPTNVNSARSLNAQLRAESAKSPSPSSNRSKPVQNGYIPRDENGNVIPLPQRMLKGVGNVPTPLPEAVGPHTVLGGRVASDGVTTYRQSATFTGNWPPASDDLPIPLGRVDWSAHPYLPGPLHPTPHIHVYTYDSIQRRWSSESAIPFSSHQ